MIKEFISVFQVTKMITFDVRYYTLSTNQNADFATSANLFVKNKKDYSQCGQCQESVLPHNSVAYSFFKKWDEKHLHTLTQNEYDEMIKDLQELKDKYNHIYIELDESKKPYNPRISFRDEVELSKQKLKKIK